MQQARAFVDGVAIVVDACAVGGAHFAQDGAGARHDVRDAEAVADFDQLAARDHHLAARGQFVQREPDRRGVVVDGDGGRAQQSLEAAARRARRASRGGPPRGRTRGSSSPAGRPTGPSGARPRLVCSTTPVALITRRSEGRASRASDAATRASMGAPLASPPRRISARASSSARRISSTTTVRGKPSAAAPRRSSTTLTAGNSRNFPLSATNSILPAGRCACLPGRGTVHYKSRGVAQPG